uniref:Col_cuticle_N domain-containing protein n=1 Tax=Wuchereria bancrofti TaxID=6293 RepID=A0A1I8EKI6_WUCBA
MKCTKCHICPFSTNNCLKVELNAMNSKEDLMDDKVKVINLKDEEEKHLYHSDIFTETDMKHFRLVAFIAVTLSTVTMLSCIILMPISYQYVQKVQSTMQNDMEFCKRFEYK